MDDEWTPIKWTPKPGTWVVAKKPFAGRIMPLQVRGYAVTGLPYGAVIFEKDRGGADTFGMLQELRLATPEEIEEEVMFRKLKEKQDGKKT